MSVHPLSLAIFCLSTLLTVAACDDDSEKIQTSITGRWELSKAFRNQKETETLQGVYFQFGADGKMLTNLPVAPEEPTEYKINKNEILQKSAQPVTYFIQNLTDSTLVLAMEMRGVPFELQFRRAAPPTEATPQDSLSQPADSLVQPADSLSE